MDWLIGRCSYRGQALAHYRRGIKKARKQDHQGAIVDYTAAIDMTQAPPDVKAMAQYNRALVHLATKNTLRAIEDLKLILAMNEMVVNLKSMARLKLLRIESQSTNCSL